VCQPRGLVVCPSEAFIPRVPAQRDFGKLALYHVGGAVIRAVVYDNGFEADALRLKMERFETLSEMVATVPVGNANRYVQITFVKEGVLPSLDAGLRRAFFRCRSADGRMRIHADRTRMVVAFRSTVSQRDRSR